MKELEKMKLINKAEKIVCDAKFLHIVASSENANDIMKLPDEYPKFSYTEKWLKKVIRENLWDWQRNLDDKKIKALDDIINIINDDSFKVEDINMDALSKVSFSRCYRSFDMLYDARMITVNDYRKVIARMIVTGKSSEAIDNNVFLFMYCSGVEAKEHENIDWQVLLMKRGFVFQSAKSFEKLTEFSDKERNLIDILGERSRWCNAYVNIDKTVFDDAEHSAELLKALTDSEADRIRAEIIVYNWLQNGSFSELAAFFKNTEGKKLERYIKESYYLNIIFENRFDGLTISCDMMRYIFNSKKNSFLKKIKKLAAEGVEYKKGVLLDYPEFRKLLNLNELSEGDILKANNISVLNDEALIMKNLSDFNKINGRTVTPKEFFTLLNMMPWVAKIYVNLKAGSIDEGLIKIKEIPENYNCNDVQAENIMYCLRQKRISAWRKDFSYIKNLEKADVLNVLAHWDYLNNFISEVKTVDDIYFLLSNKEDGKTLEEKRNLYLTKEENIEFINGIGVTLEEAKEFALSGNLEIAKAYDNSISGNYKVNLKKIVKAAILGKLDLLKYVDIDKEIGVDISDSVKKMWKENSKIVKNGYEIAEYDDFKSTMIIGEKPTQTCQSYKSGCYNECLLSNFDANKKIIYVIRDGEYLARAILRITRASDNDKGDTLGFIDVTDALKTNTAIGAPETCLFLEKPYIKNGISDKEAKQLETLMKELVAKKAKDMKIAYYCNTYYEGEKVEKYIYISRSKNGRQYLDSLKGNASVGDEAQFIRTIVKV